jgi:hypothetical protein
MGMMMAKQMAATIAHRIAKSAFNRKLFTSTLAAIVVGNGGGSCNSGSNNANMFLVLLCSEFCLGHVDH